MSQQSVRQAAQRSALDAQAMPRKERADREPRLEGLAVEVLTAEASRAGRGAATGQRPDAVDRRGFDVWPRSARDRPPRSPRTTPAPD